MLDECGLTIKLCLVMFICLSSCRPVPTTPQPEIEVGDGGFLTGEPCGPPCFWGIVPGETTEAETVEILQERGIYGICETWDREREGGYRGINCGRDLVIGFERGSDLVTGVGFNPSGIVVQDVVDKYGEPDGVMVSVLGVHALDYQLILAYPSMFTLVRLSLQDEAPYVLKPSTPVKNIAYDVVFDEEFSRGWEEWHGYGEYYP